MTPAAPSSVEIFLAIFSGRIDRVPVEFCLNFDFELSPSNSTKKSLQERRFVFQSAVAH